MIIIDILIVVCIILAVCCVIGTAFEDKLIAMEDRLISKIKSKINGEL